MPFLVGDARELTNYKSTCMIMNETVKKYSGEKGEYYSYKNVLKKNADQIIQDERKRAQDSLQSFLRASIGK